MKILPKALLAAGLVALIACGGGAEENVAATEHIRKALGWVPRYDRLDTIVAHALAWERRLGELQAR